MMTHKEMVAECEDAFYKGVEAYSKVVIDHFRLIIMESVPGFRMAPLDVINRMQAIERQIMLLKGVNTKDAKDGEEGKRCGDGKAPVAVAGEEA